MALAALGATLAFAPDLASAAEGSTRPEMAACGPIPAVDTVEGHIDYRLRNSSPVVKKGVHDLETFHMRPALQLFHEGSLFRSIRSDIDFTLRHSPNHHIALQTLIQYEKAGGKDYELPSMDCYLEWATEFTPDDITVWLIGGYYFWNKKDLDKAEKWYLQAAEIDPESADAHYNLGLLYCERRDYKRALTHAQVAYATGYPLRGLREKLKRAGQWQDPPPAPASP